MNISVIRPSYLNQFNFDDEDFFLVVDTFRATTTLAVLANLGAKKIYVVNDQHDAKHVQEELCSNCLLIGEERGIKIAGFDYGNSPSSILRERIQNKSVIFTSSNGAKTLIQLRNMKNVYLGALVNLSSISEFVGKLASKEKKNIIIIPAGHNNNSDEFIVEDWITSVLITKKIIEMESFKIVKQDEFWNKSLKILDQRANLEHLLVNSTNGRYLTKLGFENDIIFSISIDKMNNFLKVKEWLKIGNSDCIVLE